MPALLWTVGAALVLYFVVPKLLKPLLAARVMTRVRASGSTCLTFDDGPNPGATPAILDALDAAGAKATFFVIAQQVEQHRGVIREILARGHEIGEHGYAHLHAWKTLPWRYLADLRRGGRVIEGFRSNASPRLFRPPYGEINLFTLLYVWFTARTLVLWNVNPRDFEAQVGETVAATLRRDVNAGSVVLLHDGRAGAPGEAQVTVDATRALLSDPRVAALRLVTVSRGASLT